MSKSTAVMNVNTGESWIGEVLMIGLSLLLCLTLAFAAFDYVVAKVPDGAQGVTKRNGWYFRSGQWCADVRTLAAAFKSIVDSDPDTPVLSNSPVNQLVTPALRPGPIAP